MKKVFKVLIYIILVFIMILYLSRIYGTKYGESVSIKDAKNIDIYFVGNSGFIKDISPMKIYENSGITSYVIGASWAQIPMYDYLIKENTKTNIPKLIVLDMESFFDGAAEEYDHLHYAIDKLPLNSNKIEFINHDCYKMSTMDKLSFIFPIIRFHDRWDSIKLYEYVPITLKKSLCENNNCYGNVLRSDIFNESKIDYMELNSQKGLVNYNKQISTEYIFKIKEYCDVHNIKLLLLMPPHQAWSNTKYETLNKWANKENFEYIDLNTNINGLDIDLNTDFHDGGHLNINGTTKVSKYLAKYLKDNYNFKDHRNDSKYSLWNKNLEKYKLFENEYFKEYNNNLKSLKISEVQK